MCGIVGYLGKRNAAGVLLGGLRRLEYRGYDSAGVALFGENELKAVYKKVKPERGSAVDELDKELILKCNAANGGIGHTRWATHGQVTEANTHPHVDCRGEIYVVHNGMVANFGRLRSRLEARHRLVSETDTELLAHLIEEEFDEDDSINLLEAVRRALRHVSGTYGLAVMSSRERDKIICACNGTTPIVVGLGDEEVFVASDEAAFIGYTRRVMDLKDGEIAEINTREGIAGTKRAERFSTLDPAAEGKNGHPTFMLKEILEQPQSVRNAFNNGGRLLFEQGDAKLGGLDPIRGQLRKIDDVLLLGCGTAYHAAKIGAMMLTEFAGLPYARAEIASEVRSVHVTPEKTAVIAVSQSGTTADTLEALQEAIRKGALPIGVINREGSQLARLCGRGVYCNAGEEIAVASTKAFTSQVVALALISLLLGRQRQVPPRRGQALITALKKLPEKIEEVLSGFAEVKKIAAEMKDFAYFMFIGRGLHAWVASEGSLKMKEITYRPCESYPAGELKHGPIALLNGQTATIALAPKDDTFDDMVANLGQAHRTGTKCVVVTTPDGVQGVKGYAWKLIVVPNTMPILQPILSVVPLQLLAYFLADALGLDPDRPRNLAKSVTVK